MLYMFEIRGEGGRWEPLGTGDDRGNHAIQAALHDLASLWDGGLPPGNYRYLPVDRDAGHRWRYFRLSTNGSFHEEGILGGRSDPPGRPKP